MTTLVANAMQQYDYIIIDTAPMVVANDAVIFMKQGGTLEMVCCRDQTLKRDLHEIADELETLDMPVTGVIINCAKENKKALENSNYYYYCRDQTLKRDLHEIADELETLDMPVTGVIINCAKENKKALENSNYYYYSKDQTLKRDLHEIADELETLDMPVTGVIINCAKENKKALENSNYYYYSNSGNAAKGKRKK